MKSQEFPKAMEEFLPEVSKFSDTVHKDVLYKLYRRKFHLQKLSKLQLTLNILLVFALSLELPSETFVDKHKFELHDESWFRCKYSCAIKSQHIPSSFLPNGRHGVL